MRILLKNRVSRLIDGSIELNEPKVGSKMYLVTAYDGVQSIGFILHASDAVEAQKEASLLITSNERIAFTTILHKLEPSKPKDIIPSEYISYFNKEGILNKDEEV